MKKGMKKWVMCLLAASILFSTLGPVSLFAAPVEEPQNEVVTEEPVVESQEQQAEPQIVTTEETEPVQMLGAPIVMAENISDWMPDPQMQQAVADALGITPAEITKDNILNLTTLYAGGMELQMQQELSGQKIWSNSIWIVIC